MNYSEISLKVFAAMENSVIKNKGDFWENYSTIEKFNELVENNPSILKKAEFLRAEFEEKKLTQNFISAFDDNFPKFNQKVSYEEIPYLIFYNGDINLLQNRDNICNVIGVKEPTNDIVEREKSVVTNLINDNKIIISSLVDGCNMEALKICYEKKAPAIIVSAYPLNNVNLNEEKIKNINPEKKADLTRGTVYNNGLIISEYYKIKSTGSQHIQCAKLQVVLSSNLTLIASCEQGNDSFSIYSMDTAYEYEVERFVLYNDDKDKDNNLFSLNKYYAKKGIKIIKE